jgi:cation:H+ antiporter
MVPSAFLPDLTAVDVGVLVVATAVVWVGSGWLESSAEALSAYYGLPPVIQGSVVVAIGSSFPELASVVVAAAGGVFDIGVGAVVGSAIFNVLVIPALSGLASDDPLEADRAIVYKEAQFYMLAVSALVITFALAVIYFPTEGTLAGEIPRSLAAVPLLLYGLYVFIQSQEVGDYEGSVDRDDGDVAIGRQWGLLAAGLVTILLAVELLVGAVESLGETFGVPAFLAGVVVVAGATSLPDAVVSVRTARAGRGLTSLGNVLGSNTFDLLVAIPVGVFIVGRVPVNFSVAVPMFGVLTVATILLFVVLRTDLEMSDREAYGLLLAYGLFVAWIIAETVGVTNLILGT